VANAIMATQKNQSFISGCVSNIVTVARPTVEMNVHIIEALLFFSCGALCEKQRQGACYNAEVRFSFVANGIGNGLKDSSEYGIQTSARTSARAFGTGKEGKLRGDLLHREQRPALERNIIDTSPSGVSNRLICEGQKFLESLAGSPVTLSGRIELYKGRPEIVISSPSQIVKE
jgi:hypothetical protein